MSVCLFLSHTKAFPNFLYNLGNGEEVTIETPVVVAAETAAKIVETETDIREQPSPSKRMLEEVDGADVETSVAKKAKIDDEPAAEPMVVAESIAAEVVVEKPTEEQAATAPVEKQQPEPPVETPVVVVAAAVATATTAEKVDETPKISEPAEVVVAAAAVVVEEKPTAEVDTPKVVPEEVKVVEPTPVVVEEPKTEEVIAGNFFQIIFCFKFLEFHKRAVQVFTEAGWPNESVDLFKVE